MYMEEFTNKTNLYKAKTFGTTQFIKLFLVVFCCYSNWTLLH